LAAQQSASADQLAASADLLAAQQSASADQLAASADLLAAQQSASADRLAAQKTSSDALLAAQQSASADQLAAQQSAFAAQLAGQKETNDLCTQGVASAIASASVLKADLLKTNAAQAEINKTAKTQRLADVKAVEGALAKTNQANSKRLAAADERAAAADERAAAADERADALEERAYALEDSMNARFKCVAAALKGSIRAPPRRRELLGEGQFFRDDDRDDDRPSRGDYRDYRDYRDGRSSSRSGRSIEGSGRRPKGVIYCNGDRCTTPLTPAQLQKREHYCKACKACM